MMISDNKKTSKSKNLELEIACQSTAKTSFFLFGGRVFSCFFIIEHKKITLAWFFSHVDEIILPNKGDAERYMSHRFGAVFMGFCNLHYMRII